MPARKSCWSRIIGERAVRPIASSTSASIDASVPCTISTSTGSSVTADHHVPELVDAGREPRVDGERRAELLDDGRPGDLVPGAQPLARVQRGVVPPVAEEHAPPPGERVAAFAGRLERRPRQRADAGDPEVDPLDDL